MIEKTASEPPAKAAPASAAAARPDTSAMTDRQLARAVLDKTLKPRAAEIRRLAEAVAAGGRAKKAKKAKAVTGDRKLAKIPGQKKRKKKG